MEREQIEYIQKYLHIDIKKISENSDIINNTIFYKKDSKDTKVEKKADIEEEKAEQKKTEEKTEEKDTERSIYDLLNCSPVKNYQFQNKKFAVCLTHDVDDIYVPFSHNILSSLYLMKGLEIGKIIKYWNDRNRKEKSPYWNFKDIMKLEEQYDARSSFYFIATGEDIRRFRYNIEDLENELSSIIDNGWEVGLHGGYYSYNSLDNIIREKNRIEKILNKKLIGYRNHYLMFDIPDTWKLLDKAGFKYDTTFGYNNKIGFKNGMCHPFKPFDLENKKEINITEIPLNIMDTTFFNSYFAFKNNILEVWIRIKNLIDNTEKYNGVVTILWHNYVFSSPFRRDWAKLYDKILNYCYEKNALMTSGEEILKLNNY